MCAILYYIAQNNLTGSYGLCRIILLKGGMVKKLVLIGALVLVILVGGTMVGCGNNVGKLSAEVELQIKQDFADSWGASLESVKIHKYYGTYNESVVIMMQSGALPTPWQDDIDGVTFKYNDGHPIIVWKGGQFYELREAYENLFLSKKDLQIIAKIQNKK